MRALLPCARRCLTQSFLSSRVEEEENDEAKHDWILHGRHAHAHAIGIYVSTNPAKLNRSVFFVLNFGVTLANTFLNFWFFKL